MLRLSLATFRLNLLLFKDFEGRIEGKVLFYCLFIHLADSILGSRDIAVNKQKKMNEHTESYYIAHK